MLMVEIKQDNINLVQLIKKLAANTVVKHDIPVIITIGTMTSHKKSITGNIINFFKNKIRQQTIKKLIKIFIITIHSGLKPSHKNRSDIGKIVKVKKLRIILCFFMFPVACTDINKGPASEFSSEAISISLVNTML